MKKFLIIIFVIFTIAFLIFCLNVNKNSDEKGIVYENDVAVVYDVSKEFGDVISVQYQYFIFNKNRDKILYCGYTNNINPTIVMLSDDILKVVENTGSDSQYTTYYNVMNEMISDTYENVLTEYRDNIVYIEFSDDNCYAIVKDIFSGEELYCFELDLDGAHMATSGAFEAKVDNGSKILITHPAGYDYEDVVEEFVLDE